MMKLYNLHASTMRLFLHSKSSQASLNHIAFLFTWLNLTILKIIKQHFLKKNHVTLQ